MPKIAILGYARDGHAAYDHWSSLPDSDITICDGNPKVETPADIKTQLGDDWLKDLDRFDVLVRTAGLPPHLISEANPASPDILSKVTGNISEFFRVSPTQNILGITGTKGKGTTSTLTAKMLEAAGKRVHLGGNIGIPALELLKEDVQPDDWVVLEQSSFQLIDQEYSPHIAVCLMVVPEHLNWHKDMDEYVTAKQQLFAHQKSDDVAIYYANNETSEKIASVSPGKHLPFMKTPGALVENGTITIDGQTICKINDIKLLGEHNLQNVCAAVTAVWQVSQDVKAISSVATSFTGLPHRLEFVREVNDVKYYNDSFAATPDAAMAAVQAIPENKVLILGGFDRKLPLEHLAKLLQAEADNLRTVILVGASQGRAGTELAKAGFTNVVASQAKTMSEIVEQATKAAEPGDAVLLSPGFPSFDMFKDFEDRGNQFKEAVGKL